MKINFITLFPKFYTPFIEESITKRAINNGIIDVNIINLRDFANTKHKKVDDIVYGGGQGMLLKPEPIFKSLETTKGVKILLSPQGKMFSQTIAKKLSKEKELTFIAGHYEGFDERIRTFVDMELSIGDYILTGGEIPSLVVADSIVRLLPGVIKKESHINDSFENNLLDFPQYTKPRIFRGKKVPDVLLSGHHLQIKEWRFKKQIIKTKKHRPDLYKKYLERRKNEK